MYRSDVSRIALALGLGLAHAQVCLRVCKGLWQHNQKQYFSIQPTNGDLIRSEDGAGGRSIGSRLNYLDTQRIAQTNSQPHTNSNTHTSLICGILCSLTSPLRRYHYTSVLCLSEMILLLTESFSLHFDFSFQFLPLK